MGEEGEVRPLWLGQNVPVVVRSSISGLFMKLILKAGFFNHNPERLGPVIEIDTFFVVWLPFGEEDGEDDPTLLAQDAMKFPEIVFAFLQRHVGKYGGEKREVERIIIEGKTEGCGIDPAEVAVYVRVSALNVEVKELEVRGVALDISLAPFDHSGMAVEAGVGSDGFVQEVPCKTPTPAAHVQHPVTSPKHAMAFQLFKNVLSHSLEFRRKIAVSGPAPAYQFQVFFRGEGDLFRSGFVLGHGIT